MTSLRLAEVIVEAVKAKLQQNMPNRVSEINQDQSLPQLAPELQIPDNSSYYTSGLAAIPITPALIVAEGPARFTDEGPHSFITQTNIMVWILEADPDRQKLGKRLQRQARAVIESVWDDSPQETLLGSAFRIFPLRTVPGRVFEPEQDDTWRGFYAVEFIAQQTEG